MSLESPDAPRLAARGAWLHVPPEPAPYVGPRTLQRRVSVVSLLFLVAIIFTLVGLAVAMQTATYDVWGAFLVAPVLLLLTVPIATRAARR